jgi:hypothetical protein
VEIPNLGAPGTDSRSYREHFRTMAIPVRGDTANAQGGLISVARDGERGAMVTISRIGDKTRIAVMTGPR